MLTNIQFPPCRLLVGSCSRQYTCVPEGINTLYCIVSSYIPEDEVGGACSVGGAFPVGGACSVGEAAPLTFTLTSSWSLLFCDVPSRFTCHKASILCIIVSIYLEVKLVQRV